MYAMHKHNNICFHFLLWPNTQYPLVFHHHIMYANFYIRLMNDLDAWMKEKAKTVPGLKTDILFCPHDYWSGQSGWENDSIQEMHTLKQLPSSVPIIQTIYLKLSSQFSLASSLLFHTFHV